MYNPKKRVPATVEFTDLAAPARTGGAKALVDVAAYKNADALVHVLRAFSDPAVPHPSGSVDPARDAQAMEDELILADLGVAERRLERLEKDLKKSRTAELETRARRARRLPRRRSKKARPLRALDLKGEDLKRLRGFQFLSAKPLLIVINLDEAQLTAAATARRDIERAADAAGLTPFLSRAATAAVAVCAKIELEIAQLDAGRRGGLSRRSRSRPNRDSTASSAPATICSATFRSSPSARTSAAPGRFRAARRRSSRPARSTATSRAASSARRSSATTRSSARGSMAACRDHGEVRLEGKEYVVQDGDIINFRFAT